MNLTKKHRALLNRAIDAWTKAPRNGLILDLREMGLIEEMYFLGNEFFAGTIPLREKHFLWRLTPAGRAAKTLQPFPATEPTTNV